jgi:prepilin-type N-terminal cleavage/methylation domain-containing protein
MTCDNLLTVKQTGFTLTELLIVIVIIAILAAIAIPNFQKARKQEQLKRQHNMENSDGIRWSNWSSPIQSADDGFIQFHTNMDTGEVIGKHVDIIY